MGGTILGPGTIFLMLVGAFVAAFRIDNWTSFYYNIIPILFFMLVCFTCKASIQVGITQVFNTLYSICFILIISIVLYYINSFILFCIQVYDISVMTTLICSHPNTVRIRVMKIYVSHIVFKNEVSCTLIN